MNEEIFEWYDSFLKLCKVLEALGCSYQFEEPATEEEITEFEQKTGFTLPDDYKEWLKLTKYAYMKNYDFNIYMPNEVWDSEDGYKMTQIGNIGISPRDYFINAENGKPFVYDDFEQEIVEFDSFDDMFCDMYGELESYADNYFPKKWLTVYDEMFPEN